MKNRVTDKNTDVQLSGIIIPTDWHTNGTPTAWSIFAEDEEIYQIDMRNKIGQQLKRLLKKKVQFTGRIFKTAKHQNMVTIRSFKILD